jgi:thiamine biosynthesis lipoprotein
MSRARLTALTAFFAIAGILAAGFFAARGEMACRIREFRNTRFHMDTCIIIVVSAPASREKEVQAAMEDAFSVFESLDNKLSFFKPGSLLQQINSQSEFTLTDPDGIQVISKSLDIARVSGGAFDPTLGALKTLYPIGSENPRPPGGREIAQALSRCGYRKVSLQGGRIVKPEGLMLDLGGYLKGYAVEMASKRLSGRGFENFMVDGGGNIRASGKNQWGKPWRIGLENPRVSGGIVAVIPLDNRAIATSGDYQRCFFYDGVRYHHVLDPATGKPARRAVSATVIAPDAATADAMSTAAFVKGRRDGIPFLESAGLEGIILDEEGASATGSLGRTVEIEYNGKKK